MTIRLIVATLIVLVALALAWLAQRRRSDAPLSAAGQGQAFVPLQLDRADFVRPEAAWLVHGPDGFCGCTQGIRGLRRKGMIQNLGVLADCRGRGIGRALLTASLVGFREAGVSAAQLEVCARNTHAVRLYHELGFQIRKTLYRETREVYSEYAI